MNKLLYIFVVCFCIGIIVFGHFHWKTKINSKPEMQSVQAGSIYEGEQETIHKEELIDHNKLTSNLSDEIREKVINAVENEVPVHMAVIGSDAQSKGENPWPILVQEKLNEEYGEGVFKLTPYSFGEETSIRVHSSDRYAEIIEEHPDIVLLEPFILNDNRGRIAVKDTKTAILLMKSKLLERNEEAVLILQPPHPIYQSNSYDNQVVEIREFAEENDILFLNHWENWPGTSDVTIKEYVLSDDSAPNDKGNKVWAEFISDYFIGK
ncbi:SGNH/GDSL hydrolase family protein [Pseudalkalibacillus salsuginis]|uniref:SGNH/GDSL hydrolase family protein n=1 Tax=Pseudalkalibacillus salsuginis TaxID=2910972 RepID=UPI001F3A8E09|nr:SGNH/GDSL hydrolase family protein [Pseudalkalibacillus salsuginis]MCF6410076.1 SGNH/GDSL hydrolase family protein [Pseudalkalibacillus salsuginis]